MVIEFELLAMSGDCRHDRFRGRLAIFQRRSRQDAAHDHAGVHVPGLRLEAQLDGEAILSNPVYLGELHRGDQVYQGSQPALVPSDLFERASQLREAKKHVRKALNGLNYGPNAYLLSNLVRCGDCGSSMIGISSTRP